MSESTTGDAARVRAIQERTESAPIADIIYLAARQLLGLFWSGRGEELRALLKEIGGAPSRAIVARMLAISDSPVERHDLALVVAASMDSDKSTAAGAAVIRRLAVEFLSTDTD